MTTDTQNGLGPIYYDLNTNEPAGSDDVTATLRVGTEGGKALTYTTGGGLLNCGVKNDTYENGTYHSSWTVSGFNTAGGSADLSVSG